MMRLVTADDICKALQATLVTNVPAVLAAMGWAEDLGQVKSWAQVPTLEALSESKLPAGAIESPGLVRPPARNGEGGVDVTWRVVAGMYARGDDYDETASIIRRWAAAIRAAALADVTLGGVVDGLDWVGEEYARRPERASARTLAGCGVAFDVTVSSVVELPLPPAEGGPTPIVTSTQPVITVRTQAHVQGSSA